MESSSKNSTAITLNPFLFSPEQRAKKKSYGNIHSINDRGIHEIYETLGAVVSNGAQRGDGGHGGGGGGAGGGQGGPGGGTGADSAPASPWSSPLMGRRSVVTSTPAQFGERAATAGGKLLPLQP